MRELQDHVTGDAEAAAGGTGRTFADDQILLGTVLADVVRSGEGHGALELHDHAIGLAGRARAGDGAAADELAEFVGALAFKDMYVLVRSLTMGIGRRYAELCEDDELRTRIWNRIETEFELTRQELVGVTGGRRLLDREPALQRSIDRRNPYIDTLSFVQIELLRRARAGDSGDQITRASFLAINGIAGGLRNTG